MRRRGVGKRFAPDPWMKWRPVLVLPLVLGVCVLTYMMAMSKYMHVLMDVPLTKGISLTGTDSLPCVAWRQTFNNDPFGPRHAERDKPCSARIHSGSGYCECAGGLTTKRMRSVSSLTRFTCSNACAHLAKDASDALRFPANVTCPQTVSGEKYVSKLRVPGKLRAMTWRGRLSQLDAQATSMWGKVLAASAAAGPDVVRAPGIRIHKQDFVLNGLRMARKDVETAREQWKAYLRQTPPYPPSMFAGRGIVIMGGGLSYMVPAWVNVHMLRKTGCMLPVEMFFPVREFPTPAVEAALGELGVVCRELPHSNFTTNTTYSGTDDLSGFAIKIGALMLSRFQEVIYLDSDNVPVRDPASLFESVGYQETGAVLWADYWSSSAAPDMELIMDAPRPKYSFESGQMVFDKKRVWDGLLLAALFNMRHKLYFELLSNFMGKGDKESFAYGLHALRIPYHVVQHSVGSVGINNALPNNFGPGCGMGVPVVPSACDFLGNTMTQHDPDGRLMFLHTNMSPKWNLQIPASFTQFRRRWQVLQPGNQPFLDAIDFLTSDPEHVIYQLLVDLRCAPFLEPYAETLAQPDRMGPARAMPLGLYGFHTSNIGIDFRRAYRAGMQGPFTSFIALNFKDAWLRFSSVRLRPLRWHLRRPFVWLFRACRR
ncbi:hypothetical protein WJX72_011854 [[Myrmecia] bisecta]|uniref:Uncharacterized protein n=1 Tax=[Myrmecia] bisecta TaxID=41462 RepID=A0AAW1PQY2_9CHLO